MIGHCFSWFKWKTNEDDRIQLLEDISLDELTQQQHDKQSTVYVFLIDLYKAIKNLLRGVEKPFDIVLIDLKQAAKANIQFVERPLAGSGDLKFVALSYRWGEVQETLVDTGVGYMANITSFALDDFYGLCHTITQETDLQHMQYVWVDAICVNQSNYEQRKATIYRMTEIYQRANYILADPDLHLRHLQETNQMNRRIIQHKFSYIYGYIYDLIRGNTHSLYEHDRHWMDDHQVPANQFLCHFLTTHSLHFTLA